MAHFFTHNCCKAVCISAIALTSLSSCMKDDLIGCPTPKISLGFDYTYNVKEADAFSAEVKTSTYMCSTRTESISIPTWSRLISLKTGIGWKSPTSTKASTPSSAWPVTSRTSLPVLTARMTRWNSPSPSSPQAYQPSTTCRR